MTKEQLAGFIKGKRSEAGITMYRLAQLAEISESHIQRLEKGENMCSIDVFFKLCKSLKVNQTELSQFLI